MTKTIKVKAHSRKGKSRVKAHVRKDTRGKIGKASPVDSQGHGDGADLNTGMEEGGPTYSGLREQLVKKNDKAAFRPMMEMAKSRKEAKIAPGDSSWETSKSKDGKHFIHTHTSGKTIRKKNPNWVQGDHPDARI